MKDNFKCLKCNDRIYSHSYLFEKRIVNGINYYKKQCSKCNTKLEFIVICYATKRIDEKLFYICKDYELFVLELMKFVDTYPNYLNLCGQYIRFIISND